MTTPSYPTLFREKFIAGLTDFEGPFREYCSLFGVSPTTAYDWLARHEAAGREGLQPRSSAPLSCPHATPQKIVELLLAARKAHPSWGPRKLRVWIESRAPGCAPLPAPSTIGDLLKRAGMVSPRPRRQHGSPSPKPFAPCDAPNDVWSVDFKGQFRTADGRLCYPLTLVDSFSRFLLRCDAGLSPSENLAHRSLRSAFREFGLPRVIHSDNGTPFSSTAPAGLSRLSVWWVRLGILPERSGLARPGDNARHERMHRTLKAEAILPPHPNLVSQQRALHQFRTEYNHERPHEALGQVPPARLYAPSTRPYPTRLPELEYPHQHVLRKVGESGHFKWRGQQVFVSAALADQVIALSQVADGIWFVHFGPLQLGSLSDARPDLGLIRTPKT